MNDQALTLTGEAAALSKDSVRATIFALLQTLPADLQNAFKVSYEACGEPSSILEIADVAEQLRQRKYKVRTNWSEQTKEIVKNWLVAQGLQGARPTAMTNAERQKKYRQNRSLNAIQAMHNQHAGVVKLKDRLEEISKGLRLEGVNLSLGEIMLTNFHPGADFWTVMSIIRLIHGEPANWPPTLQKAWTQRVKDIAANAKAAVLLDDLIDRTTHG